MYNHYVRDKDGNYTKVSIEEPAFDYLHIPQPPPQKQQEPASHPPKVEAVPPSPPPKTPPSQRPPEMQFANKLLGHLNLADIDSGDLLLLFLLFFLIRQKADEELLIALGFMLIL